MVQLHNDKDQKKESSDVDKEQKPQQKGSSFQEEHRDIKQSDFERSIAGTDPTRNDVPEEKEGQRTKNL